LEKQFLEGRDTLRVRLPFTILHISDLHRSPWDPIGNHELLSALLADRDRAAAEDPEIASPDAIVVTGDLVQGVPLGTPDHKALLDVQYEAAAEFLESLARDFLAGDKSRLVMVPGNHDIDWNIAKAAMEPVAEPDVPHGFSLRACRPDSSLRWSWKERRVYRISDRSLYNRRLERFDDLVERFYGGTDVLKQDLYRIHRFQGGRIAVVAFNSCLGNDCFALHGKIDERAIADAFVELRDAPASLCIAAWHHSIEGEPFDTAYMSPTTVEDLIGKGFRLGLHGHQHRAAADIRYVHLPDRQEIAVVSAGSLCAAGPSLPTGVARQYNLIHIEDDLASARIHVREMVIANNFAPARRTEFGLNSFLELTWQQPPAPAQQEAEAAESQILEAEKAIATGAFFQVPELLSGASTEPGSYARELAIAALGELEDWDRLAELLNPPATIAELSLATKALAETAADKAEKFLDAHHERLGMSKPDVDTLRRFISAKRALA
jgi:3',5'-cyclic AMP phosphodiesterase CpdA